MISRSMVAVQAMNDPPGGATPAMPPLLGPALPDPASAWTIVPIEGRATVWTDEVRPACSMNEQGRRPRRRTRRNECPAGLEGERASASGEPRSRRWAPVRRRFAFERRGAPSKTRSVAGAMSFLDVAPREPVAVGER